MIIETIPQLKEQIFAKTTFIVFPLTTALIVLLFLAVLVYGIWKWKRMKKAISFLVRNK